jgi:NAD+ kinase
MGTLGFLVDVVPKDAIETLKRLLSSFNVDVRTLLKLLLNGDMPASRHQRDILSRGLSSQDDRV